MMTESESPDVYRNHDPLGNCWLGYATTLCFYESRGLVDNKLAHRAKSQVCAKLQRSIYQHALEEYTGVKYDICELGSEHNHEEISAGWVRDADVDLEPMEIDNNNKHLELHATVKKRSGVVVKKLNLVATYMKAECE